MHEHAACVGLEGRVWRASVDAAHTGLCVAARRNGSSRFWPVITDIREAQHSR
jgi:hypothetical protein